MIEIIFRSRLFTIVETEKNNELKYSRTDNSGRFIFKGTDAGKCKIKILNQEIFGLNFDIINLNIERYPYPLIQILGKK